MSNQPSTFSLSNVAKSFTLQPLGFDAKSIVEDLWPVLRSGRLLDTLVALDLRSLLEKFVQTFKYGYASMQYTMYALNSMRHLLEFWHNQSSPYKCSQIEGILYNFALAYASAVDCSRSYTGVRENMETLFPKVVDSYGSNTILERVSKRPLTREIIERNTIQSIGDGTLLRLRQSERRCSEFVDLLYEINNMFRSFVQDESISLAQPLMSIPVWAANPIEDWKTLNRDILNTESEFTSLAETHKDLFRWKDEHMNEILKADKKARLPAIVVPEIKLQVPQDASPMVFAGPTWPNLETAIPSTILQLPFKSATCSLSLESLERIAEDVSIIKLVFHIDGAIDRSLNSVRIDCSAVIEMGNPLKIVDHNPKRFGNLSDDSHLKPKGCRPIVQARPGPTYVYWTISRPSYHVLISPFPTDFSLSLKLKYNRSAAFAIHMHLDFSRRYLWDSQPKGTVGKSTKVYIAAGECYSEF